MNLIPKIGPVGVSPLRGPGGVFKIEFSVVSNRGQLPDAIYWIKNILFLAVVIEF